jgi:hypothetical protein
MLQIGQQFRKVRKIIQELDSQNQNVVIMIEINLGIIENAKFGEVQAIE